MAILSHRIVRVRVTLLFTLLCFGMVTWLGSGFTPFQDLGALVFPLFMHSLHKVETGSR